MAWTKLGFPQTRLSQFCADALHPGHLVAQRGRLLCFVYIRERD